MDHPIKILIVEDEMIIAANISLQLTKLGYEVIGIATRGEEALIHIKQDQPDIILLDIQLKGKLDGIETARYINKDKNIPIIFLTANTDESYFNKAKATKPVAFISKPFKKIELQRAIELTISRLNLKNKFLDETTTQVESLPNILSDCIYIKRNDTMIKISINEILYVEADRNYCKIFSKNTECLLVMTLKELNDKLPDNHFLRIHRSYIVNLAHIDEVAGSHVVISKKAIPLSKTNRSNLLNRLQTI